LHGNKCQKNGKRWNEHKTDFEVCHFENFQKLVLFDRRKQNKCFVIYQLWLTRSGRTKSI